MHGYDDTEEGGDGFSWVGRRWVGVVVVARGGYYSGSCHGYFWCNDLIATGGGQFRGTSRVC